MGSLLSGELFEKGTKGSAAEEEQLTLQLEDYANLKSPTPKRGKIDGRTYKEVLRAGTETGSMSELHKSRVAWKFVPSPKIEEVPLQEHLP